MGPKRYVGVLGHARPPEEGENLGRDLRRLWDLQAGSEFCGFEPSDNYQGSPWTMAPTALRRGGDLLMAKERKEYVTAYK